MTKEGRKQNFVCAAMIIIIATIIGKVCSAIFKIPLDRFLLKTEGMAIYNSSYSIYNWILVITSTGLPIAVSNIVAKKISCNKDKEASTTLNTAILLLSIVGVFCFLILFLSADLFASLLSVPMAASTMRAMSFAVLFLGAISALRGYFQGMQDMLPTAVSQLTESFSKLVFGLLLGYLFLPKGLSQTSVGAISGVSIGTFLSLIVLCIFKMRIKKEKGKIFDKGIAKEILQIAIPITIASSGYALINLIDTATVMNIFRYNGYDEMTRMSLFGYLGRAITLYNLPLTIINAISISIAPAIASSIALKDFDAVKKNTKTAVRLTLFVAAPCCGGFIALASPILQFLYNDGAHASILQIIAFAVVFVPLTQVTSSIIQAFGKVWIPVLNMFFGCLIKLGLNFVLINNNDININGAPIATAVSYFVVCILNIITIKKYMNIHFEMSVFVRPLICMIITGITAIVVYSIFTSNTIGILISILIAAIIYFAFALYTKSVEKEDLQLMPFGDKIIIIAQKIGVIR